MSDTLHSGWRRERFGPFAGLSGLQAGAVLIAWLPALTAVGRSRWDTAIPLAVLALLLTGLIVVPIRRRPAIRWLTDTALFLTARAAGWSAFRARVLEHGTSADLAQPDLPGTLAALRFHNGPPVGDCVCVCVIHNPSRRALGGHRQVDPSRVGQRRQCYPRRVRRRPRRDAGRRRRDRADRPDQHPGAHHPRRRRRPRRVGRRPHQPHLTTGGRRRHRGAGDGDAHHRGAPGAVRHRRRRRNADPPRRQGSRRRHRRPGPGAGPPPCRDRAGAARPRRHRRGVAADPRGGGGDPLRLQPRRSRHHPTLPGRKPPAAGQPSPGHRSARAAPSTRRRRRRGGTSTTGSPASATRCCCPSCRPGSAP